MGKKDECQLHDHEHDHDHDHEEPTISKVEGEDAQKGAGGRRIFLFGRLETEVVLPVIKRLLKLNDKSPTEPIDLIINSAGGNGYNADAIIATIYTIEAPVNTLCYGHALSGACEVLASGTGTRSSYEFATLMFHQTLWEADGDITNLEIQARQGQKFRDAQIELLSRCTGKDRKQLRKDIERDFYMSAQEALAYGIIDEVISHNKAARVSAAKASLKAAKNSDSRKKTATTGRR